MRRRPLELESRDALGGSDAPEHAASQSSRTAAPLLDSRPPSLTSEETTRSGLLVTLPWSADVGRALLLGA